MLRNYFINRELIVCYHYSKRSFKSTRFNNAAKSYYILLPEMPPDVPETNTLLRFKEYPNFESITPEKCLTGCLKLAMEYEIEMHKLYTQLEKKHHTIKFDELFNTIENSIVPLNFAWRTSKHFSYLLSNSQFRFSLYKINQRIEKIKDKRWTNIHLHLALKRLLADESTNLTDFQKNWIKYCLLEMKLNGVEMTGDVKKMFDSYKTKHSEIQHLFRNKTMYAQNLFSHRIEDFSYLVECPKKFINQLVDNKTEANRGPWKITLNDNHYEPFMTYCSDRMTRWNLWHARNNVASLEQNDKFLSNHLVIEELREMRYEVAKHLGHKTYADMVLQRRMVESTDAIWNFIHCLKERFQPLAEAEMTALQEFAKSEGFKYRLAAWDLQYWMRRQKQHLYKIDHDELKNFFPLSQVLKYLFGLCRLLFNITIQDCSSSVSTWNEKVKFYKIFDNASNDLLAAFYLDPFSRSEEKFASSYMEPGRDRSELHQLLPLSYLILNIDQTNNEHVLMQFKDVQDLFYNFGHGLQQLLTKIPQSEICGQRNVPWDTLQTCPQLFLMILHHEQTLNLLARHYLTREHLPLHQIHNLLKSVKHCSSYMMMKQLYLSAFDLHLHTNIKVGWHSLMKTTWADYMPLPLDPDDNHPCSFTPIFSGRYAASYYSIKWSEMLAADIFKAFKDADTVGNDKLAIVGKRFRETYLSVGGALSGDELFKQFRGRKPDPQHLISYYFQK